MPTSKNPAKDSLRQEQKQQRRDDRETPHDEQLHKALEDTFPASDPVAAQVAVKPGAPKKRQ
ncbi:hypothetical protein [Bosea caraganae]|uniref:hypothetical protein n=1 Tax=Bosea caraganae TaxID=2763117 RepID=UPI0011C058A3|nr:hypothetical protein [Bosea caraganae]